VDAALLQQLERVQALLSSGGGQPQQAGSTPLALCCLVHAGPLVFCLRSLLQNDSLQDICSRKALYCALLRLLRCGLTPSPQSSRVGVGLVCVCAVACGVNREQGALACIPSQQQPISIHALYIPCSCLPRSRGRPVLRSSSASTLHLLISMLQHTSPSCLHFYPSPMLDRQCFPAPGAMAQTACTSGSRRSQYQHIAAVCAVCWGTASSRDTVVSRCIQTCWAC
jgi:hypothetical protein